MRVCTMGPGALSEFQTKHGELTGPFGNLWGDGGRGVGDAIMTFEMKAPVDSEGKFIGSANVETSTSTPAPTDSAYNATESSD